MNRQAVIAAMEALLAAAEAETRDLTTAELAKYDELKGQLAALDRMSARRAEVQQARVSAPVVAATPVAPLAPTASTQVPPRAEGPEAAREFSTFQEFCEAAVFNVRDQRLASLYRSSAEIGNGVRSEQRMDTGQSGGFMIPTQFRQEILRVAAPSSIVRPRATVIPAGTPPDSEIEIPALDQTGSAPTNVFGGVNVGWVAEGGSKPESDADFGLIKLAPQEVTGYITMTDKLMRNSAAAAAMIAALLPAAMESAIDFAMITGNGVGKPLGFINAPAAYLQARANANTVGVPDIVEMLGRLLSRGGSPIWHATRALLPVIVQLQDGDGRYIFIPSDITGPIAGTLMGYPLIWSERAPAKGSKGDLSLVDLAYYLVKEGSGPFIAYSEHVNFLTNKTVVKIFSNIDGRPWLTKPFTGQDNRDSSPFVVLAA